MKWFEAAAYLGAAMVWGAFLCVPAIMIADAWFVEITWHTAKKVAFTAVPVACVGIVFLFVGKTLEEVGK